MSDRAPRQTQAASEAGAAASLLDRNIARQPLRGLGIAHGQSVEDFSSLSSQNCKNLLDIQPRQIAVALRPMSEALHRQRIGARLRLIREAQGYKLREFARKHQIDPTTLSHWELGQHLPDQAYIRLLWDHYHIGPNYIYLDLIAGLPFELVDYLRSGGGASAAEPPGPAGPACGPDKAGD